MGDCLLWCGAPHISLRMLILTAGRAWKSFPFLYESNPVPDHAPHNPSRVSEGAPKPDSSHCGLLVDCRGIARKCWGESLSLGAISVVLSFLF